MSPVPQFINRRATLATALAATTVAVSLALAACGEDETNAQAEPDQGLPQGSEPAQLDPAEFTTEIDNRYWPMAVGSRWTYEEVDATTGEKLTVVVTVTDRTKAIANGVEARVVRDVVTDANGDPVEVTDDYYAQDADGNVWYLGEDTAEYENGKVVSRAGSFEAGADGAEAGVIMPADPEPQLAYRQEYYEGEAEDRAVVLATDQKVEVAAGRYRDALLTNDLNPLEPAVSELKLYAPGIGPVLTLDVSGGAGREERISSQPGG